MMRVLWAAAVLALAGCASTGGGYFAREAAGYESRMADDAAAQLARMYPPASTRFALASEERSPFVAALALALRQRGYAVGDTPGQGIAVRSLVDVLPGDMYRLTLHVAAQDLSRAYGVASDGNTYPASFWARCEAPEPVAGALALTRRPPPPPDAVVAVPPPPVEAIAEVAPPATEPAVVSIAPTPTAAEVPDATADALASIAESDDAGLQERPPSPDVAMLQVAAAAGPVDVAPVASVEEPAPKAEPEAVAEPAPAPIPHWSAEAGPSVRAVIAAWAKQADWSVQWAATTLDYPVPAALAFDGEFLDAVRYTLAMYRKLDRPLMSTAYIQQSLIVVKEAQ